MIHKSDIIKRVNEILKNEWPKVHRYALEANDKAIQPYFVVEVHQKPTKKERNLWFYDYTVYITYNPKVFDQSKQLAIADRLEELIGMVLSVNGRNLTVEDWESDFLDKTLTQCDFRLRDTENVVKAETEPMMEQFDMVYKEKGGLNG